MLTSENTETYTLTIKAIPMFFWWQREDWFLCVLFFNSHVLEIFQVVALRGMHCLRLDMLAIFFVYPSF